MLPRFVCIAFDFAVTLSNPFSPFKDRYSRMKEKDTDDVVQLPLSHATCPNDSNLICDMTVSLSLWLSARLIITVLLCVMGVPRDFHTVIGQRSG